MPSSTRDDNAQGYDSANATDMDRLAAALKDKRIVYVGETHDRMDHHQLQLAVLDALRRAGREVAVGAEWFQHSFQPELDDFIAGGIDEADMLDRTGYYERWRFDYRLYRPILQYAREHRIPVLALNAPRELTDAVSEHGLDALPLKFQSQLPSSYDRSNTEYERHLGEVFKQHPMADEDRLERFIQVQLTWDETMAEQAADYLTANPEKTLVVFAGTGHIVYGAGIPDRVQRRTPVPSAIVLPRDVGSNMPGSADILVTTAAVTLPSAGLLGVFLDTDKQERLVVLALAQDESGAGDAGLREGDVLVAVNGKAIPHLAALKLALIDSKAEDTVNVTYRRTTPAGQESETTVPVVLH